MKQLLPCHTCGAKCCRYYALEIDKPTTLADFENIKWYLLHSQTEVFVDDGKWFLQVNNPCKYLSNDQKCQIYADRPQICRDYGHEDDDILCDYFSKDCQHDLEFKTLDDINSFMKKRFPHAKQFK